MASFIQPQTPHLHGSHAQIPELCVDFSAVEKVCCGVSFCFAKGHIGDGCLSSSILFKYESRVGQLFVLSWAMVRRVAMGVLFRSDVR